MRLWWRILLSAMIPPVVVPPLLWDPVLDFHKSFYRPNFQGPTKAMCGEVILSVHKFFDFSKTRFDQENANNL